MGMKTTFLQICEKAGGVVSAYRYISYKDPPNQLLEGRCVLGRVLYFLVHRFLSLIRALCFKKTMHTGLYKPPTHDFFPVRITVNTPVIHIFTMNTPRE
jgi:hypothetical protein